METPAPKAQKNGSTALVSVQIQEAVERALQDVQQFIDSDSAREKMQYVLVRQVADNAALQKCSPESFAVAVYEMFKLGLDPRGQRGRHSGAPHSGGCQHPSHAGDRSTPS